MGDLNHVWHVWINRRQQERGKDQPWEHSLYEFKSMLEFLSYGAEQIQTARLQTTQAGRSRNLYPAFRSKSLAAGSSAQRS